MIKSNSHNVVQNESEFEMIKINLAPVVSNEKKIGSIRASPVVSKSNTPTLDAFHLRCCNNVSLILKINNLTLY